MLLLLFSPLPPHFSVRHVAPYEYMTSWLCSPIVIYESQEIWIITSHTSQGLLWVRMAMLCIVNLMKPRGHGHGMVGWIDSWMHACIKFLGESTKVRETSWRKKSYTHKAIPTWLNPSEGLKRKSILRVGKRRLFSHNLVHLFHSPVIYDLMHIMRILHLLIVFI